MKKVDNVNMLMGMEVIVQIWKDWNVAVRNGDFDRMEELRLAMDKFPKGTFEVLNAYGNERYEAGMQQQHSRCQ